MTVLTSYAGKAPTALENLIISLMRDGRERTTNDVCVILKRTTDSLKTSTGAVLKELHKKSQLNRDTVQGKTTWKIKDTSHARQPSC